MNDADGNSRSDSPIAVLGMLLLVMLLANLALPPLILQLPRDSYFDHLMLLCMGGLVGEASLAAVWAAIGWGVLPKRLATTLPALLALWFTWIKGVLSVDPSFSFTPVMGAAMIGAITYFLTMGTLITACYRSGSRLTHDARPPQKDNAFQYGIRSLIISTTAVAIVLTLGRLLVPSGSAVEQEGLANHLFVSLFVAAQAAAVAASCVWACMANRLASVAPRLAIILLFGWPLICAGFAPLMVYSDGGDFMDVFNRMLSFNIGVGTVMVCGLFVLRSTGFRFESDGLTH